MITITYFVTRFRRQYVTSGTSSNSLRAILNHSFRHSSKKIPGNWFGLLKEISVRRREVQKVSW